MLFRSNAFSPTLGVWLAARCFPAFPATTVVRTRLLRKHPPQKPMWIPLLLKAASRQPLHQTQQCRQRRVPLIVRRTLPAIAIPRNRCPSRILSRSTICCLCCGRAHSPRQSLPATSSQPRPPATPITSGFTACPMPTASQGARLGHGCC